MNKENVVGSPGGGELSAEQRDRISQKFRAAKALLHSKRPRLWSTSPSDHFPKIQKANDTDGIRNQAHINEIKRVPLNEIPKNTPSPIPMKGYKLVNKHCEINDDIDSKMKSEVLQLSLESPGSQANYSSRLCLDEICCCGIELSDFGSGEMKLNVPLKSSGMYSKGTLTRQPSCSNRFNSNYINQVGQPDCCTLSSSLTERHVFSDDFDNSILEEIETLYGQKSAEKSKKEKCDMKPPEIQCVNMTPEEDKANTDLFVKDEKLKTEHILKSSGGSDSRGEALRYSEDTVTKNMPDEYAKYISASMFEYLLHIRWLIKVL